MNGDMKEEKKGDDEMDEDDSDDSDSESDDDNGSWESEDSDMEVDNYKEGKKDKQLNPKSNNVNKSKKMIEQEKRKQFFGDL